MGDNRVNLPRFTRTQLRGAARAGAKDMDDVREVHRASREGEPVAVLPPIHRRRDGAHRVEIDVVEHETLTMIAGLAYRFLPMLENAGMPVQRPTEWAQLANALARLASLRKDALPGTNNAVADLLDIIEDLSPGG